MSLGMNLPFMFGRIKGGRCPRGDRMGDPDSMEVCDRMCEHDYDCYGDNQLCVGFEYNIKSLGGIFQESYV